MVKHSSVTGVLELSGALTTGLDLDRERQTLLLMIKPNNIIAVFFFFFFPRFYSTMSFKTFRVKLLLKTDIGLGVHI